MILGVTGKIAAGKTEIMKILEKRGFYCIYGDKIVHDLYKSGGEGAKRVAAVFGEKFLDANGAVDRIKLRNEVFEDENKLKMLNNIIHPIVYEEIVNLLEKNSGSFQNIAIEMIYMDESFLGDFVNKILWVERPIEAILKVLVEERGFTPELASKAIGLINKPDKTEFFLKNERNLKDLENTLISKLKAHY